MALVVALRGPALDLLRTLLTLELHFEEQQLQQLL